MVHRWLGLASGLVVFFLGVTGCIWSFSEEIKTWIYRDRLFVELPSSGQQKQPLSILFRNAQAALDSTHMITRAQLFEDPNRTYQFRALKINPDAFGYWNYYTYYELVYLDPYTAEVVHVEDAKYEFFTVTLALHMNLLLGKPVGHWIVQWSVVIFIILLLSGLVLWWPKHWKRKQIKQRLSIKWNANFKRLNYDLHNVPGFYSLLVLLLIASTGLVMSFGWNVVPAQPALSDTTLLLSTVVKPNRMDDILEIAVKATPGAVYRYYNLPLTPEATANVSAYYSRANFYDRKVFKYDRYTGVLLQEGSRFSALSGGAKLKAINYDLHTGTALGLSGKIIAFLASLVAAAMPVTGYIIWYGKRKIRHGKSYTHKGKSPS